MKLKEKLSEEFIELFFKGLEDDYLPVQAISKGCYSQGFETAKALALRLAASIDESWVESFADLGDEEWNES